MERQQEADNRHRDDRHHDGPRLRLARARHPGEHRRQRHRHDDLDETRTPGRHRVKSYWTLCHRNPLARSIQRCYHHERTTTAELNLRSAASGGRLLVQIVNIHLPSAIGHTTDELDNICRRIEENNHGRRFVRCILGDFNHVLCDSKCGRNNTTATVGPALRRTTTTAPNRSATTTAHDGTDTPATNTTHSHTTKRPRRQANEDDEYTTCNKAHVARPQHDRLQHAREMVEGRRT